MSLKIQVQHGEKLNVATHAIGMILALTGVMLLLHTAIVKADFSRIVTCIIYGISTVGIFALSVLYHSARQDKKEFFRKLDHIGIYFKIAGNYTPYMILAVNGLAGWSVLTVVWSLAIVGIFYDIFVKSKTRFIQNCIYVAMSATVIPVIQRLLMSVGIMGFGLVMLGFLFYAIGFLVFLHDEKIKHGHAIWHLLVIGGSASQFLCLWLYIV